MKKLIFSAVIFLLGVNASAFSLPKSLENKYCIDDVCLFTPLDKISQRLISSKAEIANEIIRIQNTYPNCEGIGGGSFEAISSKGKYLWIGMNAFPESKGNHARMSLIRATIPGSFTREQMLSVFYDLSNRYSFPKKSIVDRGSNIQVAKPDSGQEITLSASADSERLVVEFLMNTSYIENNDFRKLPECRSNTPAF